MATPSSSFSTPSSKSLPPPHSSSSVSQSSSYPPSSSASPAPLSSLGGSIKTELKGSGATVEQPLSIEIHLIKIVEAVMKENKVLNVVSATGSGKSLGIPRALYQGKARSIVSLPTRLAARGLFNRLSVTHPMIPIGLQIEKQFWANQALFELGKALGRTDYYAMARIIFAVSGHVRIKLKTFLREIMTGAKTFRLDSIYYFHVLMLDEAHDGRVDNTLISGYWSIIKRLRPDIFLRMVITSATPDLSSLNITYSEISSMIIPVDINYPVQIIYEKDSGKQSKFRRFDVIDKAIKLIQKIDTEQPFPGDILVFVSGVGPIKRIAQGLKESKLQIIELYSKKTNEEDNTEEQDTILNTPSKSRRVIISTNVAETSKTIPGIVYIVDTMLENISATSLSGGLKLMEVYISKSSAIQRAGRVGRLMPGIVYRLITETAYSQLEERRIPEIDRVPIFNYILEILDTGIDPSLILGGNINDDPTMKPDPRFPSRGEKIRSGIKLLEDLDMLKITKIPLSSTHPYGGQENKITDSGKFVEKVKEMNVRNTAILWRWMEIAIENKKYDLLFLGALVMCIIDAFQGSYFAHMRRDEKESESEFDIRVGQMKTHIEKEFKGESDLETYLNVWVAYAKENPKWSSRIIDHRFLSVFCRRNHLNKKAFHELLVRIRDTGDLMERELTLRKVKFPYPDISTISRKTAEIVKIFTPLIESVYASNRTFVRGFKGMYELIKSDSTGRTERHALFRLDNKAVNNLSQYDTLIGLVTTEISKTSMGTLNTMHIISFAIPASVAKKGTDDTWKRRDVIPKESKEIKEEIKEEKIPTVIVPEGFNPCLSTSIKELPYAWVTLVMKGDSYTAGALVTGSSLRRVRSKYQTVCMVTPDVSPKARKALSYIFDHVMEVDELSFPTMQFKTEKQTQIYSEWVSSSYTKWNCLRVNTLKKVMFVDADIQFLQNCDELFDLQAPAACFTSPFYYPFAKKGLPTVYAPEGEDLRTGEVIDFKNVAKAVKSSDFVLAGSLVLLEPNLEMYAKFLNMFAGVSKDRPYGIDYGPLMSSADEVSIGDLYSRENINFHHIRQEYQCIPWKKEWCKMSHSKAVHYFNRKPWDMARDEWSDLVMFWNEVDLILKLCPYPEIISIYTVKKEDITDLDMEYVQYNLTMDIKTRLENYMAEFVSRDKYKMKYEASNILERFMIGMINDNTLPKLSYLGKEFSVYRNVSSSECEREMMREINEKLIPVSKMTPGESLAASRRVVSDITSLILKRLGTVTRVGVPPNCDDDFVTYGSRFKHEINPRIRLLMEFDRMKGSDELTICHNITKLLLRYNAIIPGGQQWAIPAGLFDVLYKKLNVLNEAFASPINSNAIIHLGSGYYSPFSDTDTLYGSRGSFFDIKDMRDVKGNWIVNPPFIPSILTRAAKQIVNFLNSVKDDELKIVFFVGPNWDGTKSGFGKAEFYSILESHKFNIKKILKSKEHHYLDTKGNVIVSSVDSVFFTLSNREITPDMDIKA